MVCIHLRNDRASQVARWLKNPSASAGDEGSISGLEYSLEKKIATHSSFLAWEIPWTEENEVLHSMGSQGLVSDQTTKTTRNDNVMGR